MMKQLLLSAAMALALAACGHNSTDVAERANILAVGSSTVYPFTKAVAEHFQADHVQAAKPVIVATGTGPGIAAFCAGLGNEHPDIVNASRRMHAAELATCSANGVANVVELQIGSDGLAFVQSPAAPTIKLTRKQAYEALAATPYGEPNRKMRWNEVDPSLPDIQILIYGPPAKDGTRDSLVELIMVPACEADRRTAAFKQDKRRFDQICKSIRSDRAYISTGENDDQTTVAMIVNPGAIGIVGYSFLANKKGSLRGIPIDGVEPSAETIASGRYPAARPLFVYAKKEHAQRIPGLKDFLAEYASAIGPDGYLAKRGLVVAPEEVRAKTVRFASALPPLQPSALTQ